MRCAIALLSLFGLTACATRTIQPTITIENIAHVAATFRVPDGWKARTGFQYDPHEWGLDEKKAEKARCSINLHYYELWPDQIGDQQARANDELDGIHRHSDERVTMSVTDTFHTRDHGELRVYRYFSDYWHDRRVVFVVRGNLYVRAELYADQPADAERCQPILEEVAGSVAIP